MAITINGKPGVTQITELTVGSSADLASVISDESGTGVIAFTNSPTFTTPVLGTATATGFTTASGNLVIDPATQIVEVYGDGASVVGQIQLNCHVNSHGQIIASQPHSESATNTLTLPGGTTIGNSNAVLVSDTGTQTLTNKTLSAATLTSTLTAGGGVGSSGQVLQSTGSGVEWATPAAGTTANDQAFAFAVQVFA
jgi:hypothetical protein